ncbi:succinyl-CoA synthetase-like protein [Podospora aff. communis PSN243]|uniref:Succinyl-CoA synthetase-like protein n=1 Tax=Podospora aff. communis PSN243 TaxID=3040156 RepID=A0AAV9GX08_9PEZI|nr:succinyl-CoA synthetase-like protein [Podospora aff. communis PSN243]
MYRCVRPRSHATPACIPALAQSFSAGPRLQSYADTLPNLRIGRNTRVIFQGFTGKLATANATESIAWGTKIVGGVKPGGTGEHLGLPVVPTVRKAMELLKPDATAVYVAAHQAAAAIEEAIEAEVPLIVAVAEHIPLHEMLRIHSILKTQSKSRLVGPNSPGIISVVGKCRIGFQPLPCFSPGKVGIIAKSGTLSYETVASTTRAGLGQSLCVGVGGDIAPGTDLRDALSVLEHDEDTDAIALIGEIGGFGELDAADWIRDYRSRVASPKPIVGLVAGINELPNQIMGHAGAFTIPGEPSAQEKIDALSSAGVTIVNHPAKIGDVLKPQLSSWTKRPASGSATVNTSHQRRQMSTAARRPQPSSHGRRSHYSQQTRGLYLTGDAAMSLLQNASPIPCDQSPLPGSQRLLGLSIDRTSRSPCILAGPSTTDPKTIHRFPFDFLTGPSALSIPTIASHIQLPPTPPTLSTLQTHITTLTSLFYTHEAYLLTTSLTPSLNLNSPQFSFDDAAFRIAGRHTDLHTPHTPPSAGLVYLPLPGAFRTVGTLVNGAGLAMNTVDTLPGLAANFLDTGGKATSETVKASFELILADPRVKVVFVNIFGGLTLGDMIARGVVLAFEEVGVEVPVVVRIRGTREKEGMEVIKESGLAIEGFEDFEEAVRRVRELAGR